MAGSVLAITCGHTHPRTVEPERDDEQHGATLLVPEEASHRVVREGTLAPADRGTVDWFTVVF